MGGIVGCHLFDGSRREGVLARMLLAPAALGRRAQGARTASVCVFGERDCDLAEDLERSEVLAVERLCPPTRLPGERGRGPGRVA